MPKEKKVDLIKIGLNNFHKILLKYTLQSSKQNILITNSPKISVLSLLVKQVYWVQI